MPMASSTLSARVNRRGRAASRRRRSFFYVPFAGAARISRPSSAVSPRFSQAAGPFDPGAPVHYVVGYAREEPGGQQDVHQVTDCHRLDVGRAGGDLHGIRVPPRPYSSPHLPGRAAAIDVSLSSPGSFACRAWTGFESCPGVRSRCCRSTSPESRCAAPCRAPTPRCLPGPPAGSTASSRGVTMINSGRMLSAGEPLDGNGRAGSRSGAATAAAFAYAVRSGRLDLPLPGSGWTRERWAALAALAEEDLSLARLAEGTRMPSPFWPSSVPARLPSGPAGESGRSAAWSRPDRDQDRPWLAAGRASSSTVPGRARALMHW